MEYWLDCVVAPGQFTGEFAVQIAEFSGRSVSLFAPASDVDLEGSLDELPTVPGHVRVQLVKQSESLALVLLPRKTLENGQHITVHIARLHQEA